MAHGQPEVCSAGIRPENGRSRQRILICPTPTLAAKPISGIGGTRSCGSGRDFLNRPRSPRRRRTNEYPLPFSLERPYSGRSQGGSQDLGPVEDLELPTWRRPTPASSLEVERALAENAQNPRRLRRCGDAHGLLGRCGGHRGASAHAQACVALAARLKETVWRHPCSRAVLLPGVWSRSPSKSVWSPVVG